MMVKDMLSIMKTAEKAWNFKYKNSGNNSNLQGKKEPDMMSS